MYFPYLYGRQSELLALRDFAASNPGGNVVSPIFEPVKRNPSGLVRAIDELSQVGLHPIVVLNPSKGELADTMSASAWYSDLFSSLPVNHNMVPAFLVGSNNSITDVQAFLSDFPNHNSVVIYRSSHLSGADVYAIDADPRVGLEVVMPNSLNPQQRGLVSRSKAVDISDCFNEQARNSDYHGSEFFANHHLGFSQYSFGFGDYTVLSPRLPDSGGQPSAVAIHATYKEPNSGELWIEHFVSTNTQRGSSTTARKFLDAAGQLCSQAGFRPAEFGSNTALVEYASTLNLQHFPGLPWNKRQQILHHICLNRQVLLGQI